MIRIGVSALSEKLPYVAGKSNRKYGAWIEGKMNFKRFTVPALLVCDVIWVVLYILKLDLLI